MSDETAQVVYFEQLNGCHVLVSYSPSDSVPYTLRIDGRLVCQCSTKDEAVRTAQQKVNGKHCQGKGEG